jgi:hypothetical protein
MDMSGAVLVIMVVMMAVRMGGRVAGGAWAFLRRRRHPGRRAAPEIASPDVRLTGPPSRVDEKRRFAWKAALPREILGAVGGLTGRPGSG